jgi:hypothetical protein
MSQAGFPCYSGNKQRNSIFFGTASRARLAESPAFEPFDADPKDRYRKVNAMLRQALKRFGYRSLAEFEDRYERLGDMMPWPNH